MRLLQNLLGGNTSSSSLMNDAINRAKSAGFSSWDVNFGRIFNSLSNRSKSAKEDAPRKRASSAKKKKARATKKTTNGVPEPIFFDPLDSEPDDTVKLAGEEEEEDDDDSGEHDGLAANRDEIELDELLDIQTLGMEELSDSDKHACASSLDAENAPVIEIDEDDIWCDDEPPKGAEPEPAPAPKPGGMYSTATAGSKLACARIKIHNMVTRVRTGVPFDIGFLACQLQHKGFAYNRQRFAAAVIKMRNPKCSVLVFPTGVLLTTRSEQSSDAQAATTCVLNMIRAVRDADGRRPYAHVPQERMTVHNIVGSTKLNFLIDLQSFADEHEFVEYQAQIFNGANVHMSNVSAEFRGTKLTALIFGTGAVVITGASRPAELRRVFYTLFPLLLRFKVDFVNAPDVRLITDKNRRKAEHELRETREAGPDSESILPLDTGLINELLEQEQHKREQLALEAAPRLAALEAPPVGGAALAVRRVHRTASAAPSAALSSGGLQPVSAERRHRFSAASHNAFVYYTHDRGAAQQRELRRKRSEEPRFNPKRIKVMTRDEAEKHLFKTTTLSTSRSGQARF